MGLHPADSSGSEHRAHRAHGFSPQSSHRASPAMAGLGRVGRGVPCAARAGLRVPSFSTSVPPSQVAPTFLVTETPAWLQGPGSAERPRHHGCRQPLGTPPTSQVLEKQPLRTGSLRGRGQVACRLRGQMPFLEDPTGIPALTRGLTRSVTWGRVLTSLHLSPHGGSGDKEGAGLRRRPGASVGECGQRCHGAFACGDRGTLREPPGAGRPTHRVWAGSATAPDHGVWVHPDSGWGPGC